MYTFQVPIIFFINFKRLNGLMKLYTIQRISEISKFIKALLFYNIHIDVLCFLYLFKSTNGLKAAF